MFTRKLTSFDYSLGLLASAVIASLACVTPEDDAQNNDPANNNQPQQNNSNNIIQPADKRVCKNELEGSRERGVWYNEDGVKVGYCPLNTHCANPEVQGDLSCVDLPPVESTEVCLDTPIDSRLQGNIHKGGDDSASIVRSCPEGFVCTAPGNPADLSCLTTVQNEQSEWAKYPCFVNRDRAKTAFEMDCRCTLNFTITSPLRMCLRPERLVRDDQTDLRAGKYGAGPHVYEFGEFAELRGGFMDAANREIIIAGRFRAGDDDIRGAHRGFVMAIHIDSGDRRIISGDYSEGDGVLKAKGQGPGFWDAWKVLKGPDGMLYVIDYLGTGNAQIMKVDPATGDRTFVWTNEDPEQKDPTLGVCDHGSTDPSERQRISVPIDGGNPTFAIDAQGRFYLAFNQAGFETGVGIIRVGADGKSCEYFSRTGAGQGNQYRNQDLGQGASFGQGQLSGFSIEGDTLYALNFINGTAFAVDVNTGDRTLLTSGTTAVAYTVRNPHNPNELWAVGKDTTTVIDQIRLNERDIADLWTLDTFKRGPLNAGNLGSGGMWFDPTNPDVAYFSHDNWSIVKAELSTFNNYVISL